MTARKKKFNRSHAIVWERFAGEALSGYRTHNSPCVKPKVMADLAAQDADAMLLEWESRFSHLNGGEE